MNTKTHRDLWVEGVAEHVAAPVRNGGGAGEDEDVKKAVMLRI